MAVAVDISQPASTALPHVPLPEVSWQTLFWIITTLAINSMTQTCGWVCGFNSRYRPYIRSSPAICVVDIIFMLCRWIGAFVKPGPSHLNVRESFYKIAIDRFRGNDPPGAFGRSETPPEYAGSCS
ncbi:hypothetical protein DL95DRAFT_520826 [Leptodontidium sp. 2 PMI_412]|nr:hypothetical protein DL95DRAFT_520826 [Leptodontidium sp. 2 PMI_412]